MRFAIPIALVCAAACPADTLTLRSGQVVHGTYLGGTARTINMQVEDSTKTYDVTDVTGLEFTAPAGAAAADPQAAVEGRADSRVRAIIYEDLQCSDCAAFRRMLDQDLLPKYGNRVAFVHHDFPLAKHVWARRAAIAARFFAAQNPAMGLEFRRYIMASQEVTTDSSFNQRLIAFAQAHGIAPGTAVQALSNPRYAALVDQDYQEGVSRGVVHTPTVFVNGRAFIETFPVEEISKGIDDALAAAH
ncbi:MAG TPA: thioredoxin domain-containing protein [Bryobacteraceae bacterium]|nr:thioredoxin domain-containing protein [Bryobacteraceae bacterium]